jgi:hypothetical protein
VSSGRRRRSAGRGTRRLSPAATGTWNRDEWGERLARVRPSIGVVFVRPNGPLDRRI